MRHRSLNLDLKIRVMKGCSDETDQNVWCFVLKLSPLYNDSANLPTPKASAKLSHLSFPDWSR